MQDFESFLSAISATLTKQDRVTMTEANIVYFLRLLASDSASNVEKEEAVDTLVELIQLDTVDVRYLLKVMPLIARGAETVGDHSYRILQGLLASDSEDTRALAACSLVWVRPNLRIALVDEIHNTEPDTIVRFTLLESVKELPGAEHLIEALKLKGV